MPFVASVEETTPVLPAGIYPAVFTDIEEQSNDNGTFWLWHFVARNGDEDVEVNVTTSPRITPNTKSAKFLAGMGVPVEIGKDVDFGTLVDMPVQIVVIVNKDGYSRIENILPYTDGKGKSK